MHSQKKMTVKHRIGVVVAEEIELEPMAPFLSECGAKSHEWFQHRGYTFILEDTEVYIAVSGVGKVNAATAATDLIHRGCEILLNFGMSGGISQVKRGDLVLVSGCAEHDFDLSVIGYKPFEKPSQISVFQADKKLNEIALSVLPYVKCGMAVSGDSFICSNEKREQLKEWFGAFSCDMESAAIASVAFMASVPFAALRRISDDSGDDAITEHRAMNNATETDLTGSFLLWLKEIIRSFL